jgi:hypothetical protein
MRIPRTEELEVALLTVKLVEADVRLDGNARPGVTQVRVAAGHDGEALAFWLPREVEDGVWEPS